MKKLTEIKNYKNWNFKFLEISKIIIDYEYFDDDDEEEDDKIILLLVIEAKREDEQRWFYYQNGGLDWYDFKENEWTINDRDSGIDREDKEDCELVEYLDDFLKKNNNAEQYLYHSNDIIYSTKKKEIKNYYNNQKNYLV